jgi:hypothetical protein
VQEVAEVGVYPLGLGGSTQLLLCCRSDRELIVDSAACRGAADGQVWMQAWSGSCMPCKSKHRSCILLATCGAWEGVGRVWFG